MGTTEPRDSLTVTRHAEEMADYIRRGTERAMALGNRGPLRFDEEGGLAADIREAYRRCGFYVFENLIQVEELEELRADFERVLESAVPPQGPSPEDEDPVRRGRRDPFLWVKPLSDPWGGTDLSRVGDRRNEYMVALREADGDDYERLLRFAQSG